MNTIDRKPRRPALSFIAILALFQAVGGLIGWVTAQDVDGWYKTLVRSPLTPPDAAFGIVWTLLYALLAFAFWRIWISPDSSKRTALLALFAAHMVLNWLWSPLFFTLHAVLWSFVVIAVMIFTAVALGWMARAFSRWAALVFVPYTAWLCFAAHLTYYILRHN